ncbi:DUF2252 domain-containing protein [Xylophilus rhododendri]|uniref:DUF2252 domain-containing protein n=1 Tax=Xylophilus rhododendri TaxID=2697032 RepID=A0A857J474_9BURK|nr:DUF2252 domain-containing protein [Xylophilus rhododendri]QHI97668.1 DUF2252 domain-containing protein [Xylophilus rhododendri]
MDIVKEISRYNAGRDPERLQLKYQRMRADPFVFLRGACHLFYARLPVQGVLQSAPPVWCCGDLHLENFGSYKGDNRLAYFDLNDFDEAMLAPASWDLVRLSTSLLVGAASLGLKPDAADELCQAFLASYARALAAGKAYWLEPRTAQGLVGQLLDGLKDRQRPAFLDGRTQLKGRQRRLRTDGRKALPASEEQRAQVTAFMDGFAQTQTNPGFFRVLDVARRIAGTGSLGVDRYAVLVEGKGSPDGNYLLDLKQALPSSLAGRVATRQPAWASEAERVVAVQRRVQAVSMAFLHAVQMEGRPYVLRGLQPSEDRITLDGARQRHADIRDAIATMGQLVAWGQLRSAGRQGSAIADELMAFGADGAWQAELQAAARQMAQQTLADAAGFNQAWDDGAFRV